MDALTFEHAEGLAVLVGALGGVLLARLALVLESRRPARNDVHPPAGEVEILDAAAPLRLPVRRNGSERADHLVVALEDMAERKQLAEELQRLADQDALTGLFNRSKFEKEIAGELDHGRHHGAPGAVVVVGLDRFRRINECLGHEAGDQLLVAVAGAIEHRVRGTGTVARLGADEFAIFLPDVTADEADVLAGNVIEAVSARADGLAIAGGPSVTASAGVLAFGADHARTGDEILSATRLAMCEAKASGGNQHVLHVIRPLDRGPSSRVIWPEGIRRALKEGRFVLYAQPILDIAAGEITHHEMLVRMQGDDGEIILPGAFLPVAEQVGMIRAIDRWVISNTIDLLGRTGLRAADTGGLQVNLSGGSLSDPGLLAYIETRLAATGADPRGLVLEVTETQEIQRTEDAAHLLERLSRLGCTIALDDFGSGFSSFQYLRNFPIDIVKVDRAFIQELTTNSSDFMLVESLVHVTQSLGKRILAEGVEDAATLQIVSDIGFDFAQGYHIARPGPAIETLTNFPARPARVPALRTAL